MSGRAYTQFIHECCNNVNHDGIFICVSYYLFAHFYTKFYLDNTNVKSVKLENPLGDHSIMTSINKIGFSDPCFPPCHNILIPV